MTTTLESVAERAFNPVTNFGEEEMRSLGRWSIESKNTPSLSVEEVAIIKKTNWIIIDKPDEA